MFYYSNGRAAVAGYDEAYSAGSDDYFAEDAGAEEARRHNEMEAAHAEAEAAEMEAEAAADAVLQAQAQQYDDDMMHYEDNVDF